MIEVFNMPQGQPEWFFARKGLFTASNGDKLLMKGRGGGESETRKKYLYQLAGEIITGEPTESFSNMHTDRGHVHEPIARTYYSLLHDVDPQIVGFIRNGRKGASPDGLIGNDGAIEIKSKQPNVLIPVLMADEFPPEHKAQTQSVLWIAEREWIDLICFWPSMPLFVKRAYRDEEYIKSLSDALDKFNDELDALVEKIKQYGKAH